MNHQQLLIIFVTASVLFIVIPMLLLLENLSKTVKSLTGSIPTAPKLLIEGIGNFEPIEDEDRYGPGENGYPHLLRPDQKKDVAESMKLYGMNEVCSNEISLDRSVPDTRLPECERWVYPSDLPSTSVIIVFYNEPWSVLLRTIQSVVNRTPSYLLMEILLVDDCSDLEKLTVQLPDYISRHIGKLRLIRNVQREGLIRSRNRGAREAEGKVVVFLDAHCEVNKNWLPPLLSPIARKNTVMTIPITDVIDHNTFEYRAAYPRAELHRGIFEWGLLYKDTIVPDRELNRRVNESEPYWSPVFSGGLFAIDRRRFLELGAFDSVLSGGENFELSFKVWQCGGSLECVPCSRIGHVDRTHNPNKLINLTDPFGKANYKRVVETWFDDKHKEYFYTREPFAKFLDAGNISKQLAMKHQLSCKSFQWYLDVVAYDVLKQYPKPPRNVQIGRLRSSKLNLCVDTINLKPCENISNNQLIGLNAKNQLLISDKCIVADDEELFTLKSCDGADSFWEYSNNTHILLHKGFNKCLTVHPLNVSLGLNTCDIINDDKFWYFDDVRPNL